MTVVIGAVVGERVWLAGDSYCGDDEVSDLCSEPKVLRVSNTVGLGLCGDVRTEVLVTKAVKQILSKKQRVTDEWLRTDFALALHKRLKDSGVLKDNKGIHSLDNADYILAHAGRLYYMDESLALWTSRHPYVAIGVGKSMAMSTLAYSHTNGELEEDPRNALERVLRSVAQHNHYVRPPYTYLKI